MCVLIGGLLRARSTAQSTLVADRRHAGMGVACVSKSPRSFRCQLLTGTTYSGRAAYLPYSARTVTLEAQNVILTEGNRIWSQRAQHAPPCPTAGSIGLPACADVRLSTGPRRPMASTGSGAPKSMRRMFAPASTKSQYCGLCSRSERPPLCVHHVRESIYCQPSPTDSARRPGHQDSRPGQPYFG